MAQTYTVFSRTTSALTGTSVSALSHDAAINTVVLGGPTGAEMHVTQAVQTAASGPTGTYLVTNNYASAVTGSTYSGNSPEDAKNQHKAALGPTGPGSNIEILRAV